MADRLRPPRHNVRRVRLNRRQPEISVEDLALMLEIDLALGHKRDFRHRLQRALNSVFMQAVTKN